MSAVELILWASLAVKLSQRSSHTKPPERGSEYFSQKGPSVKSAKAPE